MDSIQESQSNVFNSLEARSAIENFVQCLPANANILLIGHEAPIPVAAKLASAGHQVHGIDISDPTGGDAVLGDDFCQSADMRDYSPSINFDAIVVIFSMYYLTGAETYSQMFKFAEWLRTGGQILLATSVIDSLSIDRCRDCVDECVRCYPVQCMGKPVPKATIFSRKGWAGMASNAGLSIDKGIDIAFPLESEQAERHCLMTLRRTEAQHPLMGPYPLPQSYRGPHRLSEAAWQPFVSRLVRDEFDFVLDVLKDNQKVLDVGSGYGSKSNCLYYIPHRSIQTNLYCRATKRNCSSHRQGILNRAQP